MNRMTTFLAAPVVLVFLGCTSSDYERGLAAYEDEAYKSAIELLEPLAIGGNQAAKVALGTVYRCGDDSVQDHAAAAKWYLAGGEHKDAIAHKWLATYFSNGTGVAPNQERAREQMTAAAELGDANSQFVLSNWLSFMDWDASIHWLTLAAEQEHTYAQYRFAQNYRRGDGVPVDPAKSVYWVSRAAGNGDHVAQSMLAQHYKDGYGGLEVDFDAAVTLYETAISQESVTAPYSLGLMYAKGDGVRRNEAKACSLYRTGADRGDHKAAFELASCFDEGNGVERDLVEAYRWYMIAALIAEENLDRFLERLPSAAERLKQVRTGNHIAVERAIERIGTLQVVMTQNEIASANLLMDEWANDHQRWQETRIRAKSIWDDCP